MIKKTPL